MSEEAAIREMIQSWLTATNQAGEAGADGWVSFVSDDVSVLPPNAEIAEGSAAAREVMLAFTGADDYSITWEATRIDLAHGGDMASVVGTYEYSLKDPEGNPVEDRGKFLDVLRKEGDGSWKAFAVCFNSDLA